jgi:flagellar hook-associated protein 1 FlgK
MSIGNLLDVASRAMSVYQDAISVTGQNITNANNTDYSRQNVILASDVTAGGQGDGVKIADIQRVRNTLIDTQVQNYTSVLSDATKKSDTLQQIESVLDEPSTDGLSTYFTNFFNSFSQLTATPNSTSLRLAVTQQAQQLSDRFKQVFDGISTVQSSLQTDANTDVSSINSYLKDICQYNKEIYAATIQGTNTNQLKDERDAEITKLSGLVNITVQQGQNGVSVVGVAGLQGADQQGYNTLQLTNVNGQMRIVSQNNPSNYAIVNSGEMNAIIDLNNNEIPSYLSNLNTLANAFVDQVNAAHVSGNTLIQGSTSTSSTGIPFFGGTDVSGDPISAYQNGQININPDILNNPDDIAASSAANSDGNGDVANQIAQLGNSQITALNGQTFLDYYNTMLNNEGTTKVTADNTVQSSTTILQQLQNQQSSVSGVSMDQEMTNVLTFQRSYEASAKLVSIANDMLTTIINMVTT